MANSVSVDILFRFKEEGENFLKRLDQSLKLTNLQTNQTIKDIQNSVITLQEALENAISTGVSKVSSKLDTIAGKFSSIGENAKTVGEEVNETMDDIEFSTESAGKGLDQMDERLQTLMARYAAFGIVLHTTFTMMANGIEITLGLIKTKAVAVYTSLQEGLGNTFIIYEKLYENFSKLFSVKGMQEIGSEITLVERSLTKILGDTTELRRVVASLGAIASGYVSVVTKLLALPTFFITSTYLAKDAFNFFKSIIGMGDAAETVLGRAAKSTVTIEGALHNTVQYAGHISKILVYSAGYFLGIFNSFLVVPAILNNVFIVLRRGVSYFVDNVTGALGAVRGQLNTIFLSFRNLLFELSKAGGVIDSLLAQKSKLFDFSKETTKLGVVYNFIKSSAVGILGLLINPMKLISAPIEATASIGKRFTTWFISNNNVINRFSLFIRSGQAEVFLNKVIVLVDLLLARLSKLDKLDLTAGKTPLAAVAQKSLLALKKSSVDLENTAKAMAQQDAKTFLAAAEARQKAQKDAEAAYPIATKMISGAEFLKKVKPIPDDEIRKTVSNIFKPAAEAIVVEPIKPLKEAVDKGIVSTISAVAESVKKYPDVGKEVLGKLKKTTTVPYVSEMVTFFPKEKIPEQIRAAMRDMVSVIQKQIEESRMALIQKLASKYKTSSIDEAMSLLYTTKEGKKGLEKIIKEVKEKFLSAQTAIIIQLDPIVKDTGEKVKKIATEKVSLVGLLVEALSPKAPGATKSKFPEIKEALSILVQDAYIGIEKAASQKREVKTTKIFEHFVQKLGLNIEEIKPITQKQFRDFGNWIRIAFADEIEIALTKPSAKAPKYRVGQSIVNSMFKEVATGTISEETKGRIDILISKVQSFVTQKTEKITEQLKGKTVAEGMPQYEKALFATLAKSIQNIINMTAGSGKALIQTLIVGALAALPFLTKAMWFVTDTIDKFLPHSDAKMGSLMNLTKSGMAIPMTLVEGIKNTEGNLYSVIEDLADKVITALKPVVEMSLMGERLNVSARTLSSIEYAFAGIGVKANDLLYPLQNINKMLSTTLTEEQAITMKALGISFDEAQKKAEPAVDILLQLLDAMKTLPKDSTLAAKALETFGIMASSPLINATKMTKKEIEGLLSESVKIGAVWDESFEKNARNTSSIMERLKRLKDFLFQDFFAPILPTIDKLAGGILSFMVAWRKDIHAIMMSLGDIFSFLYSAIPILFKWLISNVEGESKRAQLFILNTFSVTFRTLFNVAYSLVTTFLDTALGKLVSESFFYLWASIKNFGTLVFNSTIAGFNYLWNELETKIMQGVFDILQSLKSSLPAKISEALRLDKAIEKTKESISAIGQEQENIFVDIFSNFEKRATENSKAFSDTLKTSFSDGLEKAFSPETVREVLNGIQREFEIFGEVLKKTIAGTPLEKDFSVLMKKLKNNFKDFGKEASKPFEQIAKGAENAAKSIQKMSKDLEISNKVSAAVNLSVQEIRTRAVGDSNLEEKHKLAMMQLDKQHMDEMKKLEEMAASNEAKAEAKKLQAQEKQNLARKQSDEVFTASLNMISTGASHLETTFANLYELSGKKVKAFFMMSKAFAIAQAIINTALGITKTMAELPFPLNVTMASAVAAMGATQIAVIASQMAKGYVRGGVVSGQDGTDTIPARLTRNEFVQPVDSVSYYGANFMEALRQRVIPRSITDSIVSGFPNFKALTPVGAFATGGMAVNKPVSGTEALTIINVLDNREIGNYLVSHQGQRILVNAMRANAKEFKRILDNN